MTRSELALLLGASPGVVAEPRREPVVISEADPRKFMTALAAAIAGTGEIFLSNPKWGANERAQSAALLSGGPASLRAGDVASAVTPNQSDGPPGRGPSSNKHQVSGLSASVSQSENRGQTPGGQQPATARSQVSQPTARGWLMIPTGGTSGQLKFARHDEETLAAAVGGFSRHFGLAQVNAVGVLPLHHVSGLMAWLRCALTGGEYRPLDWKAVEGGDLPALPAKPAGWTISLVPTQLERLLNCRAGSPDPAFGGPSSSWAAAQLELSPPPSSRRDAEIPPCKDAADWLRQFKIIFLGGGPAWPALLDRAAAAGLPLSLGYGMTETAAMVTALRPAEFLAGARNSGTALPHATVQIGADDTITLGGTSLFRGYYPAWRDHGDFATQDRGLLDERNHLFVMGRRDAVIITGGEKVEPAELETVLRGTGQFPDLVVLGLPDAKWGQQLVVVYPGNAHPDFHKVIVETNKLADYKRPKRYIPLVGDWPASGQGKVNRAGLVERVVAQLKERR